MSLTRLPTATRSELCQDVRDQRFLLKSQGSAFALQGGSPFSNRGKILVAGGIRTTNPSAYPIDRGEEGHWFDARERKAALRPEVERFRRAVHVPAQRESAPVLIS